LRITSVINALGPDFRHSILPLDGNCEAAARIDSSVGHAILPRPGVRSGWPFWVELYRILRAAKPHLLLTYNWGAIEAILPARFRSLCPVIHNESGFGPDEAAGLKRRRVVARRFLLNRIYATVVNSKNLLQIALGQYGIAAGKVRFIRNGIDLERFRPARNRELRSRLSVGDEDVLFGFVGKLRGEKNLPLLLRAFTQAAIPNARLALVGDGPCRPELAALAESLGIAESVFFLGYTPDPAPVLNALDVFAMSSVTEQTPNALLEAMACGLAAISTDVGDARELLEASGAPAIAPSGDVAAYAGCLRGMAADASARARIAMDNRARAVERYSLPRMVDEFAALYRAAMHI
jgi:glycosyltransferase involved in cell wall biosynthesis